MSSEDGFENHYEIILTGTDLTSSLLSAALSRIGKKVLHLDSDCHYGKEWRSTKLTNVLLWPLKQSSTNSNRDNRQQQEEIIKQFPEWIDSTKEQLLDCDRSELFTQLECDFPVLDDRQMYEKFFQYLLQKMKVSDSFLDDFYDCYLKLRSSNMSYEEGEQLMNDFKEKYMEIIRIDNMFVFDLCPRFLFSNEKLVKLLINSTVTKYIEFRKVSRLLTAINSDRSFDGDNGQQEEDKIEIVEVPCTRSDIFMSDIISPLEKRYLMSFLEKCYRLERNHEWYRQYENRPFIEFLASQTLTDKLRKFIQNTLLMCSDPVQTGEALQRINMFLQSFGRFCDRPFLFPMFGTEDMIQAFCRYGAVWGGTYCLGVSIKGLIIDEYSKLCTGIHLNDRRIQCDNLVTDYKIPCLESDRIIGRRMSRAIVLNTRSIKCMDPDNDSGDLSFIHLSPDFTGNGHSVYCFESDYSSRVCPRNFYLQYFWSDSSTDKSSNARKDLEPVIEKLLSLDQQDASKENNKNPQRELPQELKGKILIKIYFNYHQEMVTYKESKLPTNIRFVSTPGSELNYETAAEEAEKIFKKMYPEEEFFPATKPPTVQSNTGSSSTPNHEMPRDPLDEIEL